MHVRTRYVYLLHRFGMLFRAVWQLAARHQHIIFLIFIFTQLSPPFGTTSFLHFIFVARLAVGIMMDLPFSDADAAGTGDAVRAEEAGAAEVEHQAS